jgi:integrase
MKAKSRRSGGDGSIRKLASGRYEARLTLGYADGKRIRKNLYAPTEEALRVRIMREQQLFASRPRYYADAERITVEAFLTEWIETEVKSENRNATYRLREGTCRNHIIPYIGTLRLAHVEDDHVRALLQTLQRQGVGARTRQVVHATLRRAFAVAMRDKLIPSNPAVTVERPKGVRNQKRIFSEEEALLFLTAAKGHPYEALYVLALTTGMRQGELFALEWSDVDLQRAALRVQATLVEDEDGKLVRGEPKTASSRRIIDLPNVAVEALKEHRARSRGFEGFVFRDSIGGPLRKSNFLRRYFYPLLERARMCEGCGTLWMRDPLTECPECQSGLSKPAVPRITFHTLRHVANSILLARGANIRLLADRLGHATTRTTLEHYSHVLTGAQREAAQTLDTIFGT